MIRTRQRHHRNPGLSDEKPCYTAGSVAKTIPGCEDLLHYSKSVSVYRNDPQLVNDAIRKSVQDWLSNTAPIPIFAYLLKLYIERRPAFLPTRDLVDRKYRHHFNHILSLRNMASGMVRPIQVFSVGSKKRGSFVPLKKPITKEAGNTMVTLEGYLLHAYDFKIVMILINMIMSGKKIHFLEDRYLYFTTTYTEICKQLPISDPYDKGSHQAVFNSLKRLCGCIITWTSPKGKRKIRQILSGLTELEEDSSGEIVIDFNIDFIFLYKQGYLKTVSKVLDKLTKERPILFYSFILGQSEFTKYGRYGGRNGVDIFELWDRANLGGSGKAKTKGRIRTEMTQILNEVRDAGAFERGRIRDDKLKISRGLIKTPDPEIKTD